jgi:hypothetical protein
MMRALVFGLAVAVAATSLGFGEEIVYFENGQAMRVEKTRREGRWLFMEMESDGEMAVLLRQVSKVEEAQALTGKGGAGSTPANVVSAAGGRPAPPARRSGGRVSQSYGGARSGQEPAAGAQPRQAAGEQEEAQEAPAGVQGQDLVPRAFPRGTRRNTNRTPNE